MKILSLHFVYLYRFTFVRNVVDEGNTEKGSFRFWLASTSFSKLHKLLLGKYTRIQALSNPYFLL